jgi:hypothetical protein
MHIYNNISDILDSHGKRKVQFGERHGKQKVQSGGRHGKKKGSDWWSYGSKLDTYSKMCKLERTTKFPAVRSSGQNMPTQKRLRAQVVSEYRLIGPALHSLFLDGIYTNQQISKQIRRGFHQASF